jgi:prevent-host-death family protein
MKPRRETEEALPLTDFVARASEVLRDMREHQRPVLITQSGEPTAVLLSVEEFDRLTHRARFLEAIDAGLADAQAGRMSSDAALGELLDDEFGKLEP